VRQDQVSAAVARIVEDRAVIEQAKGMLMLICGIDASCPFDLLVWQSQHANVKLRRLAEQITADFAALTDGDTLPTRTMYDSLLLNIPCRITPAAQSDPMTMPPASASIRTSSYRQARTIA